MTYELSLSVVSSLLGGGLALASVPGLVQPEPVRQGLLSLPRNYPLGIVVMVVSAGWVLWLLSSVLDLGEEFTPHRGLMIGFVVAVALATIFFLPEYLFARAWGILLLLGTELLLSAAFVSDSPLRVVVVVVAYAWATSGIIFVAAPFTLRNLLERWNGSEGMTRVSSGINLALGLGLLALGMFVF